MVRQFYLLIILFSVLETFKGAESRIPPCLSSTNRYPCDLNGSYYCPPPSYYSTRDDACQCAATENDILQCDSSGQVYLLQSYCATFSESENTTEFGRCYYNSLLLGSENYQKLPFDRSEWNNVSCGDFNRTGILCGECEDNYTTLVYSFDLSCVKCKKSSFHQISLYIFTAFFPMTVFCILVILFNCNITSSHYHGFVLFSQIIASPIHLREVYLYSTKSPNLFQAVQLLGTIIGIWNLDFFRLYVHGFCLYSGKLTNVALELLVAVYPLLLVLVIFFVGNYINSKSLASLWKPIHHFFNKNWRFKTSIVDSIASFLVLSNTKFLMVTYDLLVPVKIFTFTDPNDTVADWRLLYDPSIVYLGPHHLTYALLALLIFAVFVVLPILLLLFYPLHFFQKLLNQLPYRCHIYLDTFVDLFQGCYKNGTQAGSRDCRWFSVIPFVLRIALLLLYAVTLDSTFALYASFMFTLTALLTILVDPYRSHGYNSFLMFIFFLACYCTLLTAFSVMRHWYWLLVVTWIVLALPFFYISMLTLNIIFISHKKSGLQTLS